MQYIYAIVFLDEISGAPLTPLFEFVEPSTEVIASTIVRHRISWSLLINQQIITQTFRVTVSRQVTVVQGATTQAVVLTGSQQFIEIESTGMNCMSNTEDCAQSGMTLSFNIMFKELREHTYIFSSGGELDDSYGCTLLYAYGKFHAIVTTRTRKWIAVFSRVQINSWSRFDISWSLRGGLAVYIDNVFITRTVRYFTRTTVITKSVQSILYFGRSVITSSTSVSINCQIEDISFDFATKETLMRIKEGEWPCVFRLKVFDFPYKYIRKH